jgi:exopolyphosphatase / guanosine-5'-triphosphate,3'-diphosphate pyrophosphatase
VSWLTGQRGHELSGQADAVNERSGGPGREQATGTAHGAVAGVRPGPVSQPGTVRVAAIDCGTNSLRLLIADIDPVRGTLTDLSRRMEIVRLGQGVDATGRLAADALDRTFRMLAEYAHAIESASATAVRMVATSATRDAANADEFVRGVTAMLGVAPEVLSGDQEARLGFLGATAEFGSGPDAWPGPDAGSGPAGPALARLAPPYLVTDIGGGSTEFVVGGNGAGSQDKLAALSVDIGCVRLTERHLHSDPPAPAEIAAATADIDAALSLVAAKLPVASAGTLVGLAGSVTTVAAIALGLDAYDPDRIHHARIPARTVSAVTAELLRMSRLERASISVMHPGRVDVIGAGALVLDRILQNFGFTEVVVSEHDILDGIAWSLAGTGLRP